MGLWVAYQVQVYKGVPSDATKPCDLKIALIQILGGGLRRFFYDLLNLGPLHFTVLLACKDNQMIVPLPQRINLRLLCLAEIHKEPRH